jgi:hypothetical protein
MAAVIDIHNAVTRGDLESVKSYLNEGGDMNVIHPQV